MKDDKGKFDDIARSITAELESVEMDVKAPKQHKERVKSLLEKLAKLNLKVRYSHLTCCLKCDCLALCNHMENAFMCASGSARMLKCMVAMRVRRL